MGASGRLTIRFRLGLALAVALFPVLVLGALQVATEFNREGHIRQVTLTQAATRSALTGRARIQGAMALLDTLRPEAVGLECTPRLAAILNELDGYRNIVRLDADGRVVCAGASLPAANRASLPWFQRLKAGTQTVVARSQAAGEPALIAATRAERRDGHFDGALIASILLSSLKPDLSDPTLPARTAVAIVSGDGHYLVQTDRDAFAPLPADWRARLAQGHNLFTAKDAQGAPRDYAAAQLLSGEAYVVLSAPAPGIFYWARLNPFSAIVFPVLAWLAAWVAVWLAVDRVVIRWLHYLDRIASIYARGRFTVRPLKAERAPAEIRDLAHTLDAMADAIVARDMSLRDSLAQKDTLMREIHHRVKNNLQVITSLINMQQRALTDPAARAAMSDTRQRITALALIYRALYQGPDLRRVDVRQFLEELVGQLGAGEGGRPAPIRTELHADDLEIDPDKLAPLALFAVEAITNARKHAFGPEGGSIDVRFRVLGDEVVLEIQDDGQGDAASMPIAGVGRTLMSAFARQLRGHTEVEPAPHCGVCVRLTFPRPQLPEAEELHAGNQAAA
ncbi:sensor histidine kinase [Caulobacter sp. S45]|uniref:sensor histidine kinase PhyK n=1 Tax=Caulobacter sp. S45 TaxID=1641861 RepID=UPI0015771D3F|nr:sensor histidine kinase [Caulobacter sp. S45]